MEACINCLTRLEGGRVWGVLLSISVFFCDRQSFLIDYWDDTLMAGSSEAVEEEVGDDVEYYKITSVHLSRATEAIRDLFFWATLHIIRAFGTWLGHLEHWASSCPCHRSEFREFHRLDNDCPLRGCRAPDIAAGCKNALPRMLRPANVQPSALLQIDYRRHIGDC